MDISLAFLSTPYSKHPRGLDAAWREACDVSERLRRTGQRVFSPIEEGHRLAAETGVDPLDWEFWMACYEPWVKRCDVLIVAALDGWEQSIGVTAERDLFARQSKPISIIHPFTLRPL